MNCPLLKSPSKSNILKEKFSLQNKKLFLYQGGLSYGRGIELLLESFEKLSTDYCIIFLGDGVLASKVTQYSNRNDNIFHHKSVSQYELLDYTTSVTEYVFMKISLHQ